MTVRGVRSSEVGGVGGVRERTEHPGEPGRSALSPRRAVGAWLPGWLWRGLLAPREEGYGDGEAGGRSGAGSLDREENRDEWRGGNRGRHTLREEVTRKKLGGT